MAEGPKGIAEATGAAIEHAVESFKDGIIRQVESQLIEDWFNHLNWSQKDIDDEVAEMEQSDSHAATPLKFRPTGQPFQSSTTLLWNGYAMGSIGQKTLRCSAGIPRTVI